MSDLRKQLDAAKDEYRSARYPGNLAEELLAAPRHERSSLRLYIGAIGGLAAAAVVGFLLLRPASTIAPSPSKPTMVAKLDHPKSPTQTPTQTPTTTQTSDESAEDSMSLADLAAMPAFPDDISISPAEDAAKSTATTVASTGSKTTTSDETSLMAPSAPSMTDFGSMPSLGSMDFSFSFSDSSDTSSSNQSS